MPAYLLQATYNADGWAALVRKPQDRMEAIRPAIEELGGSVVQGWLAFGEYDIVAIVELPDNIAAAACSIAFSAGGAVKAVKTTPLLSMAEAVQAMEKAGASSYEPATA